MQLWGTRVVDCQTAGREWFRLAVSNSVQVHATRRADLVLCCSVECPLCNLKQQGEETVMMQRPSCR